MFVLAECEWSRDRVWRVVDGHETHLSDTQPIGANEMGRIEVKCFTYISELNLIVVSGIYLFMEESVLLLCLF